MAKFDTGPEPLAASGLLVVRHTGALFADDVRLSLKLDKGPKPVASNDKT
jgi:hypothetical protein